MAKELFALIYRSSQEYSHSQDEILLVSPNENVLDSLQDRLTLFCNKNEQFVVAEIFNPSLADNSVDKEYFYFVSESTSDYNYHYRQDFYENVFELPKKLKEEQSICKIKICNNPTRAEINSICHYIWSFNDLQKQVSLYRRLERYKRDGSFYEKENEEKMNKLQSLLSY